MKKSAILPSAIAAAFVVLLAPGTVAAEVSPGHGGLHAPFGGFGVQTIVVFHTDIDFIIEASQSQAAFIENSRQSE